MLFTDMLSLLSFISFLLLGEYQCSLDKNFLDGRGDLM